MKIHNNSDNNQVNAWTGLVRWLFLNPELAKHIPETVSAEMSQLVKHYAESEKAKVRIDDLAPSAKRQPSSQTKTAVKILVGGMSAIAFSAGAQILTSRLGHLSVPASLGIGSVAGVLADTKATQVITRKRRKRSTEQTLQDIEAQKQVNPPVNQFGEQFYQTQTALVLQVEGKNLEKQPLLDVGLAVGLSGAEYAMSLAIVGAIGLPGGFLLNAIAASVPVAMLWTAASIQSECFDMPEHHRDLIEKYLPYPKDELTAQEQNQLALINEDIARAERVMEYELALEACRQKFVSEGDPSDRLKNWAMGEADFKIKWLRQENKRLDQERDQEIEKRLFRFKADLAELDKQFQPPVGTYSPEQIQTLKNKWLKEKARELEQDLAQSLKWLNYKYGNKFQQIEEEILAAQQQYREAYQAWKKENDNPDDDLNNAA